MSGYLDKEAIINALTLDDIKKILKELGSAEYKDYGEKGIAFKTVCHGGNKYKLYYYHKGTDTYPPRIFHCYTDCGDTFGICELVLRAKRAQGIRITFYQALQFIASTTNNTVYTQKINISNQPKVINDWEWIASFKEKKIKKIPAMNTISEFILEMFCYIPHEEWLKEGISRDSLMRYEIGYWAKENKITIPHRDMYGRLVGIRGRALNEEEIKAGCKYMPLKVEGNYLTHELGSNLYGLNVNLENIKRVKKIILFEAEKSCLLCDTYYGYNSFAVAVCGSNITLTQCNIIKCLGVRECMIAFDKEYEDPNSYKAEVYFNKLSELAKRLTPYMTVYLIMDVEGLLRLKDSPADRGKEVLEKLMKNKIEIKTMEVVQSV